MRLHLWNEAGRLRESTSAGDGTLNRKKKKTFKNWNYEHEKN